MVKQGIVQHWARLLHSPSLLGMIRQLMTTTETTTGPVHSGLAAMHCGIMWPVGLFPPFFEWHWQSPAQPERQANCLPLGLCKKTVKESIIERELQRKWPHWRSSEAEGPRVSSTSGHARQEAHLRALSELHKQISKLDTREQSSPH